MSDFMFNSVPPGGYVDELDRLEESENEDKHQSLADWVVESAIEEYLLRKKGVKIEN